MFLHKSLRPPEWKHIRITINVRSAHDAWCLYQPEIKYSIYRWEYEVIPLYLPAGLIKSHLLVHLLMMRSLYQSVSSGHACMAIHHQSFLAAHHQSFHHQCATAGATNLLAKSEFMHRWCKHYFRFSPDASLFWSRKISFLVEFIRAAQSDFIMYCWEPAWIMYFSYSLFSHGTDDSI